MGESCEIRLKNIVIEISTFAEMASFALGENYRIWYVVLRKVYHPGSVP